MLHGHKYWTIVEKCMHSSCSNFITISSSTTITTFIIWNILSTWLWQISANIVFHSSFHIGNSCVVLRDIWVHSCCFNWFIRLRSELCISQSSFYPSISWFLTMPLLWCDSFVITCIWCFFCSLCLRCTVYLILKR